MEMVRADKCLQTGAVVIRPGGGAEGVVAGKAAVSILHSHKMRAEPAAAPPVVKENTYIAFLCQPVKAVGAGGGFHAEAVLPEKPGRRQRGGSQIPMHKGNHPFIIMDQSLRIDPVAHQREGVVGGYPAAAGVRAGAKPIAPLLRRDIPLVIDQIAHFDFSSGWAAM